MSMQQKSGNVAVFWDYGAFRIASSPLVQVVKSDFLVDFIFLRELPSTD